MTTYTEIQFRLEALADFASKLTPTEIPLEPMPRDVRAAIDDIERLWAVVDPLVRAIAEHVQERTGFQIDKTTYVNQLRGALEGNLTFEIDCAATDVAQALAEAAQ